MGKDLYPAALCACLCILVAAQDADPGYLKREHSLLKPYSGNGMSIPMWDFRDNVMITNNFIRLTQDHQGKRGSLWNRIPCFLRDWEFRIHFKVHGGGRSLAADGVAIWYTKQRMEPGPVFGSRDKFMGLGLFLDTYKNGPQAVTFPFITGMINNGSIAYDHQNDGRQDSIGSCLATFRNKDYDTYIILRYVQQELKVSIDIDDSGVWKECFRVSGVILPTGYFLGVSAATGDLADNHDIISMKMYEVEVKREPGDDGKELMNVMPHLKFSDVLNNVTEDAHRNASMSGFKLFLLAFCGFLGLGVCIVVGFMIFQKHQEKSRKRFY